MNISAEQLVYIKNFRDLETYISSFISSWSEPPHMTQPPVESIFINVNLTEYLDELFL